MIKLVNILFIYIYIYICITNTTNKYISEASINVLSKTNSDSTK